MLTTEQFQTRIDTNLISNSKYLTVFSPPGIVVRPIHYPTMLAGILANTTPSEHIAVFDHPRAWKGFGKDTIITMRKNLFQFVIPIDAQGFYPKDVLGVLQKVALSVTPVALGVEGKVLPPRQLNFRPGILPAGPEVFVKNIELLSEPEISRVAKHVCKKDIPAAESVWQLLEYDYDLEQIARLMSLGLLGRYANRRLISTRAAFKAVIDGFIDMAIFELAEAPLTETVKVHISTFYGDTFAILTRPGEPRVDYLRAEQTGKVLDVNYSFEDHRIPQSRPAMQVFADHARFSAYQHMVKQKQAAHIIIFHHSKGKTNSPLEPWLTRFGIAETLEAPPTETDNLRDALTVLDSFLNPGLGAWLEYTPLLDTTAIGDSIQLQLV